MLRSWWIALAAAVLLAGAVTISSIDREPPRPLWQDTFDAPGRKWRQRQACCPHSFRTVTDHSPGRGRVGRFEVRPDDVLPDGSARAQLAVPRRPAGTEVAFSEGDDRWFGWSLRLDRTYPVDTEHWSILAAWKEEGEGEGPLKLSTSFEEDAFRLEGPGGDTVYWRGPLVREKWVDFLVRVRFSPDPNVGSIEVWTRGPADSHAIRRRLANGADRMRVRTMEPGVARSYLKIGIYRDDEGFSGPSTVLFDDVRIGESLASVAR
jgi:hypothetical protein